MGQTQYPEFLPHHNPRLFQNFSSEMAVTDCHVCRSEVHEHDWMTSINALEDSEINIGTINKGSEQFIC
jgi:hypothetical protein